jgi:threonyl-tRNA synthetase
VVAIAYGDALWDLTHVPPAGETVSAVMIDSAEGLEILRHSAAHVAAQAVQTLHPQGKLGIGPPVTDATHRQSGTTL